MVLGVRPCEGPDSPGVGGWDKTISNPQAELSQILRVCKGKDQFISYEDDATPVIFMLFLLSEYDVMNIRSHTIYLWYGITLCWPSNIYPSSTNHACQIPAK